MVGIGYQLPSEKHHHLFFAKLPLNQQTVQAPPPSFSQSPLCIGFSRPPLKVRSFHEPQKYESFSSLIPSYLLKVTKFLDKISQFELLVITEKNIFAYKLFLSLNISDFNLFLCKNCTPLKKSHPFFPSNPL